MLSSRIVNSGNVTLIAMFERGIQIPMATIQDYAVDIVSYYTSIMGFYPHNYLVIIHGHDEPNGGFPVDKGIIAIHGVNKFDAMALDYWKWIVAHEIAHMYWGYNVLDDVPRKNQLGWITIGLGIYLDKMYVKAREVKIPFHDWLTQAYLDLKTPRENTLFDLSNESISKMDFDYNKIIYHGKSYYIIKRIEEILGHERFLTVFKKMAQSFTGKKLNYEKMREYIKNETGQMIDVDVR